MKRHLLLTGGLVAAVGVSLVLANDATHPKVATDTCTVAAAGPAVEPLKPRYNVLYRNGSNPLHDVALDCKVMGHVWLNEPPPPGFQVTAAQGNPVTVVTKTYQFMPLQWRISVAPYAPKSAVTQ